MRPYPEEVVQIVQRGVMSHFLPELTSSYAKAQFAFSMLLFGIATRELDGIADDLVTGNAAIRELLAEARTALAKIDGVDVKPELADLDALPGSNGSLRLSALRAENDALRAAVARLAPLVEPAADDERLAPLRDLREKLYAHLQDDARRRIVPILTT
jgi:hypothetical protein